MSLVSSPVSLNFCAEAVVPDPTVGDIRQVPWAGVHEFAQFASDPRFLGDGVLSGKCPR